MQSEFDWDRAQRDALIDEADLLISQTVNGSTVSRAKLVQFLRVLNGFVSAERPECYAGQSLLAVKLGIRTTTEPEESKRGHKTVQRIVRALEQLGLVIVERKRPNGFIGSCNHYRVIWSELAVLSSKRRAKPALQNAPPEQVEEVRKLPQAEEVSGLFSQSKRTIVPNQADYSVKVSGLPDAQPSNTSNTPTTHLRVDRDSVRESDPWALVVVSCLEFLSRTGATRAVTAAKERGLSADEVSGLIERYRRESVKQRSEVTPGYLYRWLTGESEPENERREIDGQRGDALSAVEIANSILRSRIVKAGRRNGLAESAIAKQCELAGVTYE